MSTDFTVNFTMETRKALHDRMGDVMDTMNRLSDVCPKMAELAASIIDKTKGDRPIEHEMLGKVACMRGIVQMASAIEEDIRKVLDGRQNEVLAKHVLIDALRRKLDSVSEE